MPHPDPKRRSIGVDLGGTNIKTALVLPDGAILARDQRPTCVETGVEGVISRMVEAVRATAEGSCTDIRDLVGVGVGAPGTISAHGAVGLAPNLRWHDVPLRSLLQDRFPVPVAVDNDANVAALAETRVGSGRGCESLFFITLGTGIGGGIVINGKIHHGASFGSGEVGHMCILPGGPACGCGQKGCLEALASGTAMVRDAREALDSRRASRLRDLCGSQPDRITPELICRAAREGDRLAGDIIRSAAYYLGIAIANVINLISPDVVAIGGGISEAGPVLMDPIIESVDEHTQPRVRQNTRVVRSQLSNEAGALGAGLLMF